MAFGAGWASPAAPLHALLALRVAREERLLAGVHIERKGEPSLDFTPFVVEGMADDVALDSLLLLRSGETEEVPELAQLRANVGRLGGRLRTFPTVKEYFAVLLEHGVTPMRLATEEERGKLNDMLRTSMTGGMSRKLLGDLRSFLLPRATHLADTLQRMRTNLDACRRTRAHVLESGQLEAELRSVAEAGERSVAPGGLASPTLTPGTSPHRSSPTSATMVATSANHWTARLSEYLDQVLGVGALQWRDCGPPRLPVYLDVT